LLLRFHSLEEIAERIFETMAIHINKGTFNAIDSNSDGKVSREEYTAKYGKSWSFNLLSNIAPS
jgi:hypothetical protein